MDSPEASGMLFWDVDTQVDFLLPEGRLYVPGSEKIIPNLRRLTAWAGQRRIPVVSSACAHQPGDPELQIYGQHCMAGTSGQQKVPETLLPNRLVVANRSLQLPDLMSVQQVIIEKQAFDPFTNPNTEQIVQQFGQGRRVVLYGVATDICVACAAGALLDRGHHVELVTDAVAALDEQKGAALLQAFMGRGGRLVTTAEIARESTAG
jgi:nicotinamidase/pyrazinamidase